jgi:hypothetical protein
MFQPLSLLCPIHNYAEAVLKSHKFDTASTLPCTSSTRRSGLCLNSGHFLVFRNRTPSEQEYRASRLEILIDFGLFFVWGNLEIRMILKIWRYLTLTCTALLMGTTLCHVLEMQAKMQFDASLYLKLQQSLYTSFGPPNIGPYLEIGAIATTVLLLFLVHNRKGAFTLTFFASICLLLAFPAVYYWLVEPVNVVFEGASSTPPANWNTLRWQWEIGHALRFCLHFIAFSALLLSVLRDMEVRAIKRPVYLRGHSEFNRAEAYQALHRLEEQNLDKRAH